MLVLEKKNYLFCNYRHSTSGSVLFPGCNFPSFYRTDERAELGRFTDSAKINAYAITAMRWAVGSGLMKGYPDNTLQPNGTLTRAEAATLLVWLAAKV